MERVGTMATQGAKKCILDIKWNTFGPILQVCNVYLYDLYDLCDLCDLCDLSDLILPTDFLV